MVYKRAFLTIGEQAMEEETSVTRPPRRLAHSRLVVYSQSMFMGMLVFGTYDGLVHSWKNHFYRTKSSQWNADADHDEDNSTSPPNPTEGSPIWLHGIAGAASGVSRSLFWVGWERFVYDTPHSLAFSWRATVPHAIGHGVLFGGYYGLRTLILDNSQTKKKSPIGGSSSSSEEEDYYPIVASFLAGGWAGQLHHMVHHYTSHWRELRMNQMPQPPRIRSTMAAFVPMAMCFAAFEHGAEGVEELLDKIQSML